MCTLCMIAYRPVTDGKRGGNIPNAVIDAAMTRHPDGFGVAYREDSALKVLKYGPKERKAFRASLKHVDRAGLEYVAHFRYATHGPKDAAHAHPYEYDHAVDGHVVVFHNGVIDIRTAPVESDTEVFVDKVLAQLPSRWWESGALVYLVNEAIGWSKLTIMTATETINLHDSRGEWDNGIWYSSSHLPAVKGKWTPKTASTSSAQTPYMNGGTQTMCKHYALWREDCDQCGRKAWKPKDAQESASTLITPEDAVIRVIDRPRQFTHAGHRVTAIRDIDMTQDGDHEDAVICDTCRTPGTVYVIEGNYFIDMSHMYGSDADDGNEDLLPVLVSSRGWN